MVGQKAIKANIKSCFRCSVIKLKKSSIDMPSFVALKQQKPSLKLMVAIGGFNQGSTSFSLVCNDDTLRADLVNNIYNYLITNNLDGIDIDWEYPAQRGGISSDKVNSK